MLDVRREKISWSSLKLMFVRDKHGAGTYRRIHEHELEASDSLSWKLT